MRWLEEGRGEGGGEVLPCLHTEPGVESQESGVKVEAPSGSTEAA